MAGPFEQRGKLVIGFLMVGVLAFSLIALQQQFDQGDHRRAVEMLAAKTGTETWSIAQELNERASAGPLECEPRITSSFAGLVEVSCPLRTGEPYKFTVDLVRKKITAANAPGEEVLAAVAKKNQSSAPEPSSAPSSAPSGAASPPSTDAGL